MQTKEDCRKESQVEAGTKHDRTYDAPAPTETVRRTYHMVGLKLVHKGGE